MGCPFPLSFAILYLYLNILCQFFHARCNKQDWISLLQFISVPNCGIQSVSIRVSLIMHLYLLQRSFQEAPQISENSGNSGSKFFETCDRAFIVKTIESEEVEMMHNLLPKYHQVTLTSYYSSFSVASRNWRNFHTVMHTNLTMERAES